MEKRRQEREKKRQLLQQMQQASLSAINISLTVRSIHEPFTLKGGGRSGSEST